MNMVVLSGRIATDLQIKYTEDNTPMLSFNLAVKDEYKTMGEYGTNFFRCVSWRSTAENLKKYKEKGDFIEVYGKLNKRDYDKNGERRYITEVHVRTINYPPIYEQRKNSDEEQPEKPKDNGKQNKKNTDKVSIQDFMGDKKKDKDKDPLPF